MVIDGVGGGDQYRSHFYVAGITNERKYLGIYNHIKGWSIMYPAIRRGDIFVCPISGDEVMMTSHISSRDYLRGIRL